MTPPPEAVVDASVALQWVLNEPESSWARALPGTMALVAPTLIWTECANGLWRIARVAPAMDASHAFAVVSTVPLQVVEPGLPIQARALRLGRDLDLDHPVYDCLYLALALDRGAALATVDRRFLRVLRRAAVLPPERILSPPDAG